MRTLMRVVTVSKIKKVKKELAEISYAEAHLISTHGTAGPLKAKKMASYFVSSCGSPLRECVAVFLEGVGDKETLAAAAYTLMHSEDGGPCLTAAKIIRWVAEAK